MAMETQIINNRKFKRCKQCKEFKTVDEFHKAKHGRFGVRAICKDCISIQRKQEYESDKNLREKRRRQAKVYYQDHKEQVKAYVKKWMREHPEYVNRHVKKWQEENRDYYRKYIRESHREWRKKK